jgi:hypothetical protein
MIGQALSRDRMLEKRALNPVEKILQAKEGPL